MATIITKNSSTASSVPAAGSLQQGELAVNVTDKKLYTKDSSAAVVKLVGSLGNQEASAVAITGGTINGTTIGATTPSTGAFTTASASSGFTGNLTGNVTGNVSGTASNVTGVVAIANGGTGLSSLGTGVQTALGQNVTGSGSIVLATSPSLTTPNLGTPSAAVLTNATGLPLTTGVTGTLGVANGGTGITAFGTGVATALGQNVTGSGGIVLATSPSLTTPNLGTPSAVTLTNATGLPISTGVSGLGTGVATALAVNTGSSGAFVVNGGALGTPSSGTLTNATGLPLSTGVTGTLATTNGGTGLTSFTANGVVYASSTSALATGSALTFDGTNLSVGGSNSQQRLNVVVPVFTTNASGGMRIGDSANNYYVDQLVTTDGSANPFWDVKFATHTLSRYAYGGGNNFWAWYANNSEAMRLTSTGLGIGTSSPAVRLQSNISVNGLPVTSGTTQTNGALRLSSTLTTSGVLDFGVNGSNPWIQATDYTDLSQTYNILLNPNGGNLGLGVTPSAWNSSQWSVFEGAYGGALAFYKASNVPVTVLTSNAYNDGSWKYKTTDPALQYEMDGNVGIHKWYTAPSGTAGNAISFTQAMTLDASENLLVGTTTSNGRLTVQGADTGSTNAFYVSNSSAGLAFRVQNDGYINTGTLGTSPYNNTTGSAANLFVDSGGGIARSTSSLKYKTDIKNAEHGLAEVMQLRSVTYKGKNDGNTVFGGLIAEEVHAAGLTEFVQYAPDGSPDALAYGNMVSLCIKAIQEQQAIITDLRARVAQLEAK